MRAQQAQAARSSSHSQRPAVKKSVQLGPLPLALSGSLIWNLESHRVQYKLACKDTILRGKLVANIEERAVEYRKRVSLPSVPGSLIIGARWQYDAISGSVKPSYNVGWELGRGAELTKVNSIRFKPRLFYKHIGVEALTEVSVQLPKQLVFDTRGGMPGRALGAAGNADSGADAWGVNLDVQELNLVLRL
ncbi:hypothetical protein FOA52_008711 [Chlamydomonas sp. UWO 241]|nr:hypothetical protein FOA52_008711 [Chlamydomonas sp. UWO 241]